MFVSLNDLSVFIVFAVDQHDVSVICLRFLVQKLEDALRAGKSHDDAVELHTHLVDGHAEALIKSQKACQAADCKAGIRIKSEKRSHQRDDHVVSVAHLRIDGTDDICKGIGLKRTLVEFFIEFIESLNGLLFVAEHFDNFLSSHSLLDKAVQFTDILLLRDEILARSLCNLHRHKQHQCDHRKGQDSQRDVEHKHHGQDADDRDRAVEELRDTLADHLSERINIVGIHRHDVAVGMRVKIFNRERFHMIEKIFSEPLKCALIDMDHDHLLCKSRSDTDPVKARNSSHCPKERSVIRIRSSDHWCDVSIDQSPCEHCSLNIGQHRDNDADQNYDHLYAVVLEHIAHDSL